MAQLAVNLTAIVLAGVTTLSIQRRLFERRRLRHPAATSAARLAGLRRARARRECAPMIRQLAIMLAAFAAGTAVAAALGAASLGVALGVGQFCFAAALVWVLLR